MQVRDTRANPRLGARRADAHVYRVARKRWWSDARATRSIRHVASCASTPRNLALYPLSPLTLSLSLPLFHEPTNPLGLLIPLFCSMCCSPTPCKRNDGGNTLFLRFFSSFSLPWTRTPKEILRSSAGFFQPGNNKYTRTGRTGRF